MAKVTANYEVVYIIDPAQGEEGIAALVAKFKTLAEQNGSAVEVEEWGSRKLAYPINYKTEGYYVLMTFNSIPSFPRELDRVFRITDGIMRALIVCTGGVFCAFHGDKGQITVPFAQVACIGDDVILISNCSCG